MIFAVILIVLIVFGIPILLTVWNIYAFIVFLAKGKDKPNAKAIEAILLLIGGIDMWLYLDYAGIISAEWHEQLYQSQLHFFVSVERLPTLYTLLAVALLSYIILRYISAEKLSPIAVTFGIAGAYVGIILGIVLSIQLKTQFWPIVFAGNCVIILIKTVCIVIKRRNEQLQNAVHFTRFQKLSRLLNKWSGYPILAFIALIPLMGTVLIIISLFGQQPSDIIKLWTETADWTFSQKTPPQNIVYDQHYLCTVAAGGHRRVVKPLRTGVRHGNRIVVNRQLCIANAFEDVIQKRNPRLHKGVRFVYDNLGYPIAKHIRSRYVADAVYFVMKPLEWIFLLFLYTVCSHPEDLIAVQYPHSKPPHPANRC